MSDMIYLTGVRISFPAVAGEPKPHAKPSQQNPNPTRYWSTDLLLDPASKEWQDCWAAINATAQEKWAEHGPAVLNIINGDRKQRSYGKGEEKLNKKTMIPYDGYAGQMYISANRREDNGPPQMINAAGAAVPPLNTMEYQTIARQFYGGCYANLAIKFWAQDNSNGRAIRCDLIAIQFARDGEPFGEGVVDASGAFGEVQAPASGPTPAGAPLPPATAAFGQPSAAPAPGMPAAPFPSNPGMPSFLGGDE